MMPNWFNPYYNAYQQPQQQSGGLVWVQGIEGAKSHYVSPGQSVLLMDSESNSFFIKSADASGMPLPLRIFDYTERTMQKAPQMPTASQNADYITREEFEKRISALVAERNDYAKRTVQNFTATAEPESFSVRADEETRSFDSVRD